MGYLFSVKNRQVYFNEEATGDINKSSYFGVNNFIDGEFEDIDDDDERKV